MKAIAARNARRTGKPAGSGSPSRLSANMEDYLEAIYTLSEKDGASRVSGIAEAMGVKRPSVSKALKRLQKEGLVKHSPYRGATVTGRGRQVAMAQVRSHRAIVRFLVEVLALDRALAEHDACLMEHAISQETVERLVEFIDHLERRGQDVAGKFRQGLKKKAARSANGRDARPPDRAWISRV